MAMTVKITTLNGCKISYFDSEKGDKTVVFIHGNSSSKNTFLQILDSNIKERFRLVALDLPGHGQSAKGGDWPGQDLYSLGYYSAVVAAFLNQLKIEKPMLVGHSLGGHIATGVLNNLSCSGLFIYQTPPLETPADMAQGFFEVPYLAHLITDKVTDDQVSELFRALYSGDHLNDLKNDFRMTDPNCRKNVGEALAAVDVLGEVSTLKSCGLPVCIAHGENDPLINGEYTRSLNIDGLWRDGVLPLRDCGHYPHLERPDYFIDLLDAFLSDTF